MSNRVDLRLFHPIDVVLAEGVEIEEEESNDSSICFGWTKAITIAHCSSHTIRHGHCRGDGDLAGFGTDFRTPLLRC